MNSNDIYEVDLTDVYHYKFSYGGQSPYFQGLAHGKLVASRCQGCGHTWLPMRKVCSRCYGDTANLELPNRGEILTGLSLPAAPKHLAGLGMPVGSALVLVEGSSTCIKTFVVSSTGNFSKGTRVEARFGPEIRTIADFWFVTV
jgi:uncharacterized OB-fold protein